MAPRSARPGAGAYLPPHLRAGNAGVTQQQRTLDELAPHNMIIKLVYTAEGPFSLNGCPDNIVETPQQDQGQQQQAEPAKGAATAHPQPQLACVHIESPAYPDTFQMSELLDWFAQASKVQQLPDFTEGDSRAVLSLPASISKHERAKWHSAAQRAGLNSESKGVGADRFLQISPRPLQHHPVSSDLAASCSTTTADTHRPLQTSFKRIDSSSWRRNSIDAEPPKTHLVSESPPEPQLLDSTEASSKASKPFKPRYKQVWEWCQLEGGAFWNYSQGEVREMLRNGGELPLDLQRIVLKREISASLCEALQRKDQSSALALLAAAPSGTRLSWVRDQESGGYPAHIAAFHGLGRIVQHLVASDGAEVLQQHDARRNTPITLAQQQGYHQLAAELEQLRVQAHPMSDTTSRTAVGDSRAGSNSGLLVGVGMASTSTRPPDHDNDYAGIAGFGGIASAGVTTVGKQSSRVANGGQRGDGSAKTAGTVEVARADISIERYTSYSSKDDQAFVLFGRGRGVGNCRKNSSRRGQGGTNRSIASHDRTRLL